VEDRRLFGGVANAAFDPCYHQPCDTLDNVNKEVFELMAKAAAAALETLASVENLREFLKDTK
jgi:hypothetical protein